MLLSEDYSEGREPVRIPVVNEARHQGGEVPDPAPIGQAGMAAIPPRLPVQVDDEPVPVLDAYLTQNEFTEEAAELIDKIRPRSGCYPQPPDASRPNLPSVLPLYPPA